MAGVLVTFQRLAAKEYREARRWYARRGLSLEAAFVAAVDRAVQQIAAAAESWPTFRTRYRWVRTRRFPLVLYYHILDATHVLIMAVAHGRRRLGYWLRRSVS